MHSVDCVMPEFQDPHAAITVAFVPNRMRLELVDADAVLTGVALGYGDWVWTFVLVEERSATRLISRNRYRSRRSARRVGMLAWSPGRC